MNQGKRENKTQSKSPRHGNAPARLWLYGRHAVAAALANPERRLRRVLATKNAADWLASQIIRKEYQGEIEDAKPEAIDKILPVSAVHQGLVAEAFELPRAWLKEICEHPCPNEPIVVLDQITDPQNIGAIFRSAAAFGARAIIVQDRRTPPLAGALAKAAAGAIEVLPCIEVVNIARSIEELQGLGYYCAGLTGEAEESITALPSEQSLALVMGAEGAGLRPLVAKTCDGLFRIPIASGIESLNVSNAAAISMYEVHRSR